VPEGDTVRHLADRLNGERAGSIITSCALRHPRVAGYNLTGCRLESFDAYGKHLFMRLDDDRVLHIHLLMTGRWSTRPTPGIPAWRRRVEFDTDRGPLIGIDVPIVELGPAAAEEAITAHLGPDLCSPQPRPPTELLTERLRAGPPCALTAALLDQRRLAGFGNVYAVDLPFIAGLDPSVAVADVDGLDNLVDVGTAMIRENARRGVQNTLGREMHRSATWAQGRRNRRCRVCGNSMVGYPEPEVEWHRVVTTCVTCQPAGSHTVDLDRMKHLVGSHPGLHRRQH